MRVKEEIKRIGFFWVPSVFRRKIPGTLSVFDGGTIELELIEPWSSRRIGINLKHVNRIGSSELSVGMKLARGTGVFFISSCWLQYYTI